MDGRHLARVNRVLHHCTYESTGKVPVMKGDLARSFRRGRSVLEDAEDIVAFGVAGTEFDAYGDDKLGIVVRNHIGG